MRLVEALQRKSKESYGLLQSYIHGLAYAHNRAVPPMATDEVSKLYNVASSESREARPTVESIGMRMVLFQERLRKLKGSVCGLLTSPAEACSLMVRLTDAGLVGVDGHPLEAPDTP
eukprot:2393666-Amphidinium_carterae.3